MNVSLVWQLALHFRKHRGSNAFTAFIASSSTLGIGLGCFVLVLLLSVMNGFEKELKHTLLSAIPHGELTAVLPNGLRDWQTIATQIQQDPNVSQVTPFIKATGLLQRGKKSKAVEITAVQAAQTQLPEALKLAPEDAWQSLHNNTHGIILGQKVLTHLGLQVGDKVQVLLPKQSTDLKLSAPIYLWMTIVGAVTAGGELDNYLAYMNLTLAAEALTVEHGAQGLRLTFVDPHLASFATREQGYKLQQAVYISDWTRTHGHLYQDILLVRSVVYLALVLVIAVASFNIVSSLVMAVSDKQAEIAMLKTMGADSRIIAQVFVVQGCLNGIIGASMGTSLGVLLAMNLTQVIIQFEQLIGIKLLSGDIYFIDFLPSVVHWQDVVITVSIAMLLSILATIYPAVRASKVEPAKVLGH